MESADATLQTASEAPEVGRPDWLEPDLEFIRALSDQAGGTFKKCYQCGTCSSTCELSPDLDPFPRKEMIWASWGLKDRLLTDPDVWLCHQCNDCSARCPRGGRPGDLLAAVRRECVEHFAVPRFLGRWASRPRYIPLMLGIAASLLCVALYLRGPLEEALGITVASGGKIAFSYSRPLPQWLLNCFFSFFGLLVLAATLSGVIRFWRGMKAAVPRHRISPPTRGLVPSILTTIARVVAHRDFTKCTAARARFPSHLLVFFGFLALTVVTVWVITAQVNPLIRGEFVYPFGFWSPWKILANLGGVSLVVGCLLMIRDRLTDSDGAGRSTYFDWALIAALLAVALTGFVTEILHYARLEPHRHAAYFLHLVCIFTLLVYMPYSKLAHVVYRTTALVFAEYSGRSLAASSSSAGEERGGEDSRGEQS